MNPVIAKYDQSLSQEVLVNTYFCSEFEKKKRGRVISFSDNNVLSGPSETGENFQQEESSALRSTEVGAVWPVGFKEIL